MEDAAPARSDNELCVGGVNSAFIVEMTITLIWSIKLCVDFIQALYLGHQGKLCIAE